MEGTTRLIEEITGQIEAVTDLFYQHKDHDGYLKLNETIGQLLEFAEELKTISAERPEVELNEQDFLQTLQEALGALEERDTVLLSDILQYDLIEQLNAMGERLAG